MIPSRNWANAFDPKAFGAQTNAKILKLSPVKCVFRLISLTKQLLLGFQVLFVVLSKNI